jgi:hypothetical protein
MASLLQRDQYGNVTGVFAWLGLGALLLFQVVSFVLAMNVLAYAWYRAAHYQALQAFLGAGTLDVQVWHGLRDAELWVWHLL